MALIKCPECGNHVSTMAYSCPHCGYVINPKENQAIKKNDFSLLWTIVIAIIIAVSIIFLGIKFYIQRSVDKVAKPINKISEVIRINNQAKYRESKVKRDIKYIKACQSIYFDAHGYYLSNIDSIIHFIKTGTVPVVKVVPDPDDVTFTMLINDTLGYMSIADSLLDGKSYISIDSIAYIPHTKKLYNLDTTIIVNNGEYYTTFEVSAHYRDILKGFDSDFVSKRIESKKEIGIFPGIKDDSMGKLTYWKRKR